ncbi:uncharacterized protein LOC108909965 [Anoplophora glabripennis]|uniref:uncharacterized protein LOC108909965 n=1 Tax=Anoplophora glabripennis TaxID=217634 RepID=UPI000875565A|nr:uncharacterized protein LOC108909965 [Anoplophora glabripennis]
MDNTPSSLQNSESGCFDSSRSLFESTPNAGSNTTPLYPQSRKRKASFLENCSARKLTDVIEACPLSPPFSSTFNESLLNHLEKFHIQTEENNSKDEKDLVIDLGSTEKPYHEIKICRNNEYGRKKFRSAPNTPKKQAWDVLDTPKRANTSSFVKNFSQINMQSPLNKEAYGILYPDLPPLEPCKKPLTPQKFKQNLEKTATPAKKCLFVTPRRDLFKKVFSNTIIVANIFRHLSDGDLYRLSMVSHSLKDSLRLDVNAYDRYRRFLYAHKSSKENYRITPPKSPEKEDSVAETDLDSKNFYYFCSIASELNKNQSLMKCPRCGKPSVVENAIGQCQDLNSCGYIFCQKCNSFANNPKDFRDKCNNAQIVNVRPRSRLGDLSNSTITSDYMTDNSNSFFSSSSLNLSLSNKYDSSGFFSECEGNTPVLKAKRNLSRSFTTPSTIKPRALSSKNNIQGATYPHKVQRRSSILPVIPMEAPKPVEIVEPSSPPKVKSYAICSKQSKNNLKRLTR